MSECAWIDTDDALVTLYAAQMGPASAYSTLKTKQTLATILIDNQQWEQWETANLLPTLTVEGRFVRLESGAHGGGTWHLNKEYRYRIGVVVAGTESTAVRNAKILLKRIEQATTLTKTVLVLDTSGEQVQRFKIDGVAGIDLFRKRNGEENAFYAVGVMDLRVTSTT